MRSVQLRHSLLPRSVAPPRGRPQTHCPPRQPDVTEECCAIAKVAARCALYMSAEEPIVRVDRKQHGVEWLEGGAPIESGVWKENFF